jgi:hypothetical protein
MLPGNELPCLLPPGEVLPGHMFLVNAACMLTLCRALSYPSRLVRVHLHSTTRIRHPRAWPGWTMSCVASVLMDDRTVTVALSVTEKIEALHGDLAVPRTAVVRARAVPDGLAEVHGPDMPTGRPAVSNPGQIVSRLT